MLFGLAVTKSVVKSDAGFVFVGKFCFDTPGNDDLIAGVVCIAMSANANAPSRAKAYPLLHSAQMEFFVKKASTEEVIKDLDILIYDDEQEHWPSVGHNPT